MRSLPVACFMLLTLVVVGFSFVQAHAQRATLEEGVVLAYTEPSKRLKLAMPGLGVIKEVAVKEGELVKEGQLLVQQDDEVEALEFERLQAEANSTARVEAAEADLHVKQKTFERKNAAGPNVFNETEIEEAELDMIFREKQLIIANLDSSQNKLRAQQQGARVQRMQLKSLIDGVVEKIEVWEGEMADPSKPAIIVVKNDPMYVMLKDLNTRQVSQLRVGQELEVRYPGEQAWRMAQVVFISPVADAASDRQFVRLELPNPDLRATGLPIEVKLPANLIEARPGDRAAVTR